MILIPVEISARHVHLSAADWQKLFTVEHPTFERAISQRPQFIAHERLDLIGPKGEIPGVGVVAPLRSDSQVEISQTDARRLGIQPPVAESGHVEQAAEITLRSAKGQLVIHGAIIAQRHIHASPAEADQYGLRDGDHVTIIVGGQRGGQLDHVIVRVHPTYVWALHLDTDEANALGIDKKSQAEVLIHL